MRANLATWSTRGIVVVLAVSVLITVPVGASAGPSTPVGSSGATTRLGHGATGRPPGTGAADVGGGGTNPASSASGYPPLEAPNSSKPVNSTIGYFDGYWYNSTLHVTPGNGLNASERRAYVDRVMARDELILHRNYKSAVPVSMMSRSTYQAQQNASGGGSAAYWHWNNDIWRATFIVGGDKNLSAVFSQFYGGHVLGYYSPGSNNIVLITPNGTSTYIDPPTLAHELTHAMQDQYYNISREKYQGRTQDQQEAANGLLEGQADYVKDTYAHECSDGQWSCLTQKSGGSSGSGSSSQSLNYGVEWVLYFPYAKGPGYVHSLVQSGGWPAVDQRFRNTPKTSSTIIHHQDVSAVNVTATGSPQNGWQRYSDQGVNGTDSAGEATVFSMLWWQTDKYNAGVANVQGLYQQQSPFDQFNYTNPVSAGWAGDRIVPYHKAGASADGYVWATAWQSPAAANRFTTAYQKILHAHHATQSNGVWTVPASDSYAGTYRVVTNGTRVTVVEGPSVQAVNDIRPRLASQNTTGNTSGPGTTASQSPGFGVTAAFAGLALALVVALLNRER